MSGMTSSLFWRNLLFTILQPGVVAGLIPWLLTRSHAVPLFSAPVAARQYAGLVLMLAGVALGAWCIVLFAMTGRGTLSPADPTKRLVIRGPYRYSRNPMYIGVLLLLAGESVYTASPVMWLYTGVVLLLFWLFVTGFEEPRLHRDFGEEYAAYTRQVRRWV